MSVAWKAQWLLSILADAHKAILVGNRERAQEQLTHYFLERQAGAPRVPFGDQRYYFMRSCVPAVTVEDRSTGTYP